MAKSYELAALRDRKSAAIAAAADRFTKNELSLEEYEDLVADLTGVADADELAALEKIAFGNPVRAESGFVPAGQLQSSYAVLSERHLNGKWLHGSQAAAVSFLGSQIIDFRDVDLTRGPIRLEVFTLLGSVEILVPRNLAVRVDVVPILGETTVKKNVEVREQPGQPLLIVTGSAILGSIVIKQR